MALDGEAGLDGETFEQIIERAALKRNHHPTDCTDEVMAVAGEAGRVADLAALRVDASQPPRTAELIEGTIDGRPSGVFATSAQQIGVKLLGGERSDITPHRREDAPPGRGGAQTAAMPSTPDGVHPRLGVNGGRLRGSFGHSRPACDH